MFNESNYERIFTGSQINAQYLQTLLNDKKIHSVVRDDFQSSLRAGFGVSYTDQVQVFVEKDNLVQAKRLAEKAFAEGEQELSEGEEIATNEVIQDQSSSQTSTESSTLSRKRGNDLHDQRESKAVKHKQKRSPLNIFLNVALVLYSAWRLLPLLRGESLPAWRIALSGFILIFCSVTLFIHFRPRKS